MKNTTTLLVGILMLSLAENAVANGTGALPNETAAPGYPLTAFATLGSAVARDSHLAELGWNEAQISAFLKGERAAFLGKAFPFDDTAKELSGKLRRQINEITGSGPKLEAPLPAYPLEVFSAVGSAVAQRGRFTELGWNEAQISAFLEGELAVFQGRGHVFSDEAQRLLTEMDQRIRELEAKKKQPTSVPGNLPEADIKAACRRLGLERGDSGLAYRIRSGRNGVRPRPGDTVVITCTATTIDGVTTLPQLSTEMGQLKMENLPPGLMEGLQMMMVGGQATFLLPPSISFGEGRWPDGLERGTPLLFQVTLHKVISVESQP